MQLKQLFGWLKESVGRGRTRGFTFLLIPHRARGRSPLQFHLPAPVLYGILSLAVALSLFFLGSFLYSVRVAGKLEHYQQLKVETKGQKHQLVALAKETTRLKQTVQKLKERDFRLRKLLGLPSKVSEIEQASRVPIRLATQRKPLSAQTLSKKLAELTNQVRTREHSYSQLFKRIVVLKEQFSLFPSTWPAYGNLSSPFGYRFAPWPGFHAGLDISVAYGTPVRATAAGEVIWAGWESGYGRTVTLQHAFGFTTKYGHNSRFAVGRGQKVKKGTVIAYAGSTGYSTGSHVHYEVMRYGRHLNPASFLDLDIATASRVLGDGLITTSY